MKYLSGLLWLLVFGSFLSLSPLAHADNPALTDARKDLEQAWNPDGMPPSDEERISLLKSALDILKHTTVVRGHGHLKNTRTAIEEALYELGKGDPDHKASEFIHNAVNEIRDLT